MLLKDSNAARWWVVPNLIGIDHHVDPRDGRGVAYLALETTYLISDIWEELHHCFFLRFDVLSVIVVELKQSLFDVVKFW